VEEEPELVKLPQRKNYEYYENPYLAALLKKYIKKFEWSLAEVIFSSQSQLTTCERFHEKLKDRRNLLFLFIGEREIIGSYYTEPYPSVS
jgi:type IV secretory pathway VirB4 component